MLMNHLKNEITFIHFHTCDITYANTIHPTARYANTHVLTA